MYITKTGRVVADSQTALTLCIQFQLFDTPEQEAAAAHRLSVLIRRNSRFKIATGFAGTFLIGHALTKVGMTQLFYRMLYHRKCPSWLFPVDMGATTIWERWDSLLPDGSVNPGQMTSFNHYALGSVADWMHQTIAGLKALEPGWKRFRVAPIPGGDLTYAKAHYLSPYGWIHTSWALKNGSILLEVTVPPNTTAEVVVPGENDGMPVVVGSGKHVFEKRFELPEWPVLPLYGIGETSCDDDEP
jgi:alpha-L-rhamnosidase